MSRGSSYVRVNARKMVMMVINIVIRLISRLPKGGQTGKAELDLIQRRLIRRCNAYGSGPKLQRFIRFFTELLKRHICGPASSRARMNYMFLTIHLLLVYDTLSHLHFSFGSMMLLTGALLCVTQA